MDESTLSTSKHNRGKLYRNIAIFIAICFFLVTAPFLVPLSHFDKNKNVEDKPFQNSSFIKIDGVQTHYREWNPELRSPDRKIVLIHGFYSSTYSWQAAAEQLSKSNDYIVAVDIPGFGYSSKEVGLDHSLSARSEFVWKFLSEIDSKHKGLSSIRWTIAGHSMGGGIAAKMTLEKPQSVRELILVDPSVPYENTNSYFVGYFLNNPVTKRYISIAANYYFFQKRSIAGFLSSAYAREPTKEEIANYSKPLEQAGTALAAGDITLRFEQESIDVTRIINRTLIIWGEKDTWVEYKDAKYLDENIPNSELNVLENAGHVPQETNTDEVVAKIIDFWGK